MKGGARSASGESERLGGLHAHDAHGRTTEPAGARAASRHHPVRDTHRATHDASGLLRVLSLDAQVGGSATSGGSHDKLTHLYSLIGVTAKTRLHMQYSTSDSHTQ
jgi:hypothetical protein